MHITDQIKRRAVLRTAQHASQLLVGDVVRPIRGPVQRDLARPAMHDPMGGARLADTAGWGPPELNGPEDFRDAYDCMTVVSVTAEHVSFLRPYLFVGADGVFRTAGFEAVDNVSRLARKPLVSVG